MTAKSKSDNQEGKNTDVVMAMHDRTQRGTPRFEQGVVRSRTVTFSLQECGCILNSTRLSEHSSGKEFENSVVDVFRK